MLFMAVALPLASVSPAAAAGKAGARPSIAVMPRSAPSGYHTVFFDNFSGTSLDPSDWNAFSGVASADRATSWQPSHDVVSGGDLRIEGFRAPAGGRWISGGVSSQEGLVQTFGAYNVAFKMDPSSYVSYSFLLYPMKGSPQSPYIAVTGSGSSAQLVVRGGAAGHLATVTAPMSIPEGQWHDMSLVWRSGAVSVSVDGGAATTLDSPDVPTTRMAFEVESQAMPCPDGGQSCLGTTPVDLLVPWVTAAAPGPLVSDGTRTVRVPSTPGGVAMPTTSPRGWNLVFSDDFPGPTLDPSKWLIYSGGSARDPAEEFDPSQVTVANNELVLSASKNSNGQWTTGGVSSWPAVHQVFGRYLVRFRVDAGYGVAYAVLLYPEPKNLPSEIDFAEDRGGFRQLLTATVHRSNGSAIARQYSVNMTTWHTLGVEWTPSAVIYTIDGAVWAKVPSRLIARVPMPLDLQLDTWPCGDRNGETCPDATTPSRVSMDVAWVVEYARK